MQRILVVGLCGRKAEGNSSWLAYELRWWEKICQGAAASAVPNLAVAISTRSGIGVSLRARALGETDPEVMYYEVIRPKITPSSLHSSSIHEKKRKKLIHIVMSADEKFIK